MEIQLVTRNLEITPRLQEYVEEKTEKLDRYLADIDQVRMDLVVENTRSNAHRQIAQLTVHTRGTILRAEERDTDMFAAIDKTLDKMRRQISRYKTRRQDRRQRIEGTVETMEEMLLEEPEELPPAEIVRVKRFEVLPMTAAEAIEQMELLGHQFFLFLNVDNGQINLVYRRKNNNYGLIIPEIH